jgi:hypothetical protein
MNKRKGPAPADSSAQIERAQRLRKAIAQVESGNPKSSETLRDFTEKAASEAARKYREGIQ